MLTGIDMQRWSEVRVSLGSQALELTFCVNLGTTPCLVDLEEGNGLL